MNKKSVLLIGGAGFIGSALSRYLINQNYRVHILSKHFPSNQINSGLIFHQGGLDERALLERILPECDSIIHLASSTTPGSSSRHPVLEADKNITPTLELIDILSSYKKIRMIYVSSGGTLYGNPGSNPVDESHPLRPLSFHGAGKVAMETFLRTFSNSPEINVSIIRPSNIYGPGQPLRHGFGVIRTMLEHALHGAKMEIWGDGEAVRDFLHIDDMVSAIVSVMAIPDDNHTYNVGSGIGHNLNEIRKIIESVSGKKLHAIYRPSRKIDVKKIVLDRSRVSKKTNWYPKITIEQGIDLTWKWLINR